MCHFHRVLITKEYIYIINENEMVIFIEKTDPVFINTVYILHSSGIYFVTYF